MKKKSKYGINSGNTVRLGSLYNRSRQYGRHQHVIIKSLRHGALSRTDQIRSSLRTDPSGPANRRVVGGCRQFVDDGDLDHTRFGCYLVYHTWSLRPVEVEYTLNKRGRWLLPGLIKQAIGDVQQARMDYGPSSKRDDPNMKFNLAMVERETPPYSRYSEHRVQGRALNNTCVAYHDSRQPIPHVTPRAKRSIEADLRAKAENKKTEKYKQSRRARRTQDLQDSHIKSCSDVPEEDGPLIHYDVCSPARLNSHPNHFDQNHSLKFKIAFTHRKSMCYSSKAFRKNVGRVRSFNQFISSCVEQGKDEYDAQGSVGTSNHGYNGNTRLGDELGIHDYRESTRREDTGDILCDHGYGQDINGVNIDEGLSNHGYADDTWKVDNVNTMERQREENAHACSEFSSPDVMDPGRGGSTYEYDLITAFDKALADKLNGKHHRQGRHKTKHNKAQNNAVNGICVTAESTNVSNNMVDSLTDKTLHSVHLPPAAIGQI